MIKVLGIIMISLTIGAMIGGFTNFLAIQMLFRPYHKKMLWNMNIPFTPGLIPKRQLELATQLGELVEKHLFTLESIQAKIKLPSFQQEMGKWLEKEVGNLLESKQTLNDFLTLLVKKDVRSGVLPSQRVELYVVSFVEKELIKVIDQFEKKKMSDLFLGLNISFDEKLEEWTELLLMKGKKYLYSEEGERILYQFVQQGIERQGVLGSMVGIFVAKEKLVEKLRPALIHWLEQPTSKQKVQEQLLILTEEVLQKPVNQFLSVETKGKAVEKVKGYLRDNLKLQEVFEQPLNQLIRPWKEEILAMVPRMVIQLGEWLSKQSPAILKQVGISDIVKDQILAFPLPRLERMVRDLAKKELKMITWLGALLGGIIGLAQALLITVFFT
jgi:uncharacterized membrane protein YheB (UPF0754 family)